jgi:predicted DNA-binding helix-hairpin-helix protein
VAKLSAKKRKSLPKTSFALPGKRKYPVDTKARARNALARVSQHGTASEQKAVRAKVKARYPGIGKSRSKKGGK